MRQCIAVPPAMRATAYLYTAKARRHQKYLPEKISSLKSALLMPLTTGLQYLCSADATYTWRLMRLMCLEAAKVYSDMTVELEEDRAYRMKQAAQFLLTAIRLGTQQFKIRYGIIDLCADSSFNTTSMGDDLNQIVLNTFNSSMTPELPPDVDPNKPKDASETDKSAAKGGKAPPAKTTTNATSPRASSVLTGRDALFLLSSILRETDNTWLDSPENSIAYDLHFLIRKTFSAYESQCCTKSIPVDADALVVPTGSISSLWEPVSTPPEWVAAKSDIVTGKIFTADPHFGYYSHVVVYFLLGDSKLSAPAQAVTAPPAKGSKADPAAVNADANKLASNSVNPILTKVVLYRGYVVEVEKKLRVIRDVLTVFETSNAPKSNEYRKQVVEEYATLIYGLYHLLKNGHIPNDLVNSSIWNDENLKVIDGSLKILLDKISLSVPLNVKSMEVLADVLCVERDVLLQVDNELCNYFRYTLGFPTSK